MKNFLIQIILGIIITIIGYGFLWVIGWFMSLEIPIPILIILLCYLIYKILRREA